MRACLPLLAVAIAACTASADAPPSSGDGPFFTRTGGTFDRFAFTPVDGAGVIQTDRAENPRIGDAGVMSVFVASIGDRNLVCSSGARRQGGTQLQITVESDRASFAPGTYTFEAGAPRFTAGLLKQSPTCETTAPDSAFAAESGTLTITTVSATVVTGTFEINLSAGGGTLAGSFNVPLCPGLNVASCAP